MEDKDRYAIGQQDFKTLRKDDALYIDKTAFIEKIAISKTKYYFMARPRRFGKSLSNWFIHCLSDRFFHPNPAASKTGKSNPDPSCTPSLNI